MIIKATNFFGESPSFTFSSPCSVLPSKTTTEGKMSWNKGPTFLYGFLFFCGANETLYYYNVIYPHV